MAPRAAIGERRRVPSKRMRFAHALGRTALARVGAAASPAPPRERSTFPPSPPPPPLPPLRPRLPAPPAAARGAARSSRAGRWARSPLARSARAGRCSGRGAGKGACVERTRLEWARGAGRYYARRLARARARARHSAHLAQQSTDHQPALTGAHAVVPTSFKVRRRGAVVGSRRALARGPRRARPPGAARVRCALAQCAHAGAPPRLRASRELTARMARVGADIRWRRT